MTTFRDVFEYFSLTSTNMTDIDGVSSVGNPEDNTLAFSTLATEQVQRTIAEHPLTLFLIPGEVNYSTSNVIGVANPRLAYAQVLRDVMPVISPGVPAIATTAVIESGATIAKDAHVGHFVVVERGAVVGSNSWIDHHSVVRSGVVIGSDCRIGSHVSLGGPGFGYEVDTNGIPIRISHRGGLVVQDRVEIGNNVSIAQGTIEPTIIEDDAKIDDHVFIAHNVHIGRGTFVIAGAEVSGSVKIGKHAWISPEAAILNQVIIGDGALVGLGAVVLKDVAENEVVAGVPARSRGTRRRS